MAAGRGVGVEQGARVVENGAESDDRRLEGRAQSGCLLGEIPASSRSSRRWAAVSAARLAPRCCASIARSAKASGNADDQGQRPRRPSGWPGARDHAAGAVDPRGKTGSCERRPRQAGSPAARPSRSSTTWWRRSGPSASGFWSCWCSPCRAAARGSDRPAPRRPATVDRRRRASSGPGRPSAPSRVSPPAKVTSTSTGKVASP